MRLIIATLIVLAVAAAAQEGGYQEASSTVCWDCHAPGKMENPMAPAFAIDPGIAPLSTGEPVRARIVNTWAAILSDLSLEVDLREAPGLAFAGDEPPLHNESRGTVQVNTAAPGFATQTHYEQTTIEVPAGAGALRIKVTPDDETAVGPDLIVAIRDAVQDDPFTTIDGAGRGGTEVFLLQDPATIAQHGSGTWTVNVGLQPARFDGRLDPHTTASYTVAVDAWFNTSLERVLVMDAAGPILPGNDHPFDINMAADSGLSGQSVTFTARAHVFYEHGSDTPDEAFVLYRQTFPIDMDADGQPVLGTQAFVAPGPLDDVGLDRISEAIGYAAAFLLVSSILSGGILGKRSRRAMNRLFISARRRVAFHNFLSYGILAAAMAHLALFLIEINWHWAWGLLWGGLAIVSLFGLGFTGALQVQIIRKWGFASWRWVHFGLALAAIGFTITHILLDGSHFTVRDAVGWTDPFVPDSRQ